MRTKQEEMGQALVTRGLMYAAQPVTKKLLMDTAIPTHAISLETPDDRQLATESLLPQFIIKCFHVTRRLISGPSGAQPSPMSLLLPAVGSQSKKELPYAE